ncbi:MAG: hypothetical protein COB83_13040 [Gammaproteobacteria bacterium]|nr:MAG: hypothetical protein COB83_13040 [Gammaproteobacteria bacterium]
MSLSEKNYLVLKPTLDFDGLQLDSKILLSVVVDTNKYIQELYKLFDEIEFDIFDVLGQRNLSGVVGEIFSRFYCLAFSDFVLNPHPDGRPDILNITVPEVKNYFDDFCFEINQGKKTPVKSNLSPFKYKGIEVKCTIGDKVSNYKKKLKESTGLDSLEIGTPRVNYLSSMQFWAHHKHSNSLLGLYYDYYENSECLPQILAVFYSELVADDWYDVSVGKPGSKKTSNTSLRPEGKKKLFDGTIISINNETYIEKFRKVGLAV